MQQWCLRATTAGRIALRWCLGIGREERLRGFAEFYNGIRNQCKFERFEDLVALVGRLPCLLDVRCRSSARCSRHVYYT